MIKTGALYRNLFSDYSDELFAKSAELQVGRFKQWRLPIHGAVCLDVGCGGGRTLVALKKLGAREVYGIDIDKELVDLARRRSGAQVAVGTALSLPYKDTMFDVVICSGVLHHTSDIQRGIDEIRRVLKPHGTFYLLLYLSHPRWIGTRIMRFVAKFIPFPIMRRLLFFIPANTRYNRMDNWYVEYMHILKREGVLAMLKGFHDITEVDRGKPPYNIRLVMKKK